MTLPEIIAVAESVGVQLSTNGERLRWQCSGGMPQLVKDLLVEHKPALVKYLVLRTAPWARQAEADALLAAHLAELANLKRTLYRGKLPLVLHAVLADGRTIAERFIREHALETARGWCSLELLRGLCRDELVMVRRLAGESR